MIFKYLFVGGISAFIDIGLFSLLTKYLHFPWFPVSIASFCIATLVNYYLSITHVFESGLRFHKTQEIVIVFIISGVALIVNQIVLYLFIEKVGIDTIASKFGATSIVFFWNYFGRKNIVFKSKI